MDNNATRLRAQITYMSLDRIDIYGLRGVQHAKRIEWEDRNEDTMIYPLISFGPTEAQVLMDDLWKCGIRPTEGKGSAGALAATERHLADLQKLVFSKCTPA